jgi:putative ABC transport system permease protein
MTFLLETIRLGLANLRLHKLRAFLTALGIILGVAAVIVMVSIGEGSMRAAPRPDRAPRAKNIILRSQKPPDTTQQSGGQQRSWINKFGLTREDLQVVRANFPSAEAIVPVKEIGNEVHRNDRKVPSQAYGTTPELMDVAKLRLSRGRYLTQSDLDDNACVAVIGQQVARELFPWDDPIGATLRIDSKSFTVVGLLAPVGLAGGSGAALIGRDLNKDLHIPITTARAIFSDTVFRQSSGNFNASEVQVSEVYLSCPSRDVVMSEYARLARIMAVRHTEKPDYSMIVPYELLENARKTALTYRVISAFIAGIALIVGGVGIMNIMLASVVERTREIGIRRALGATRRHIIWQFLVETSVLSASGGLIGVGLGIALAWGLGVGVPYLPKLPVIGSYVAPDVSLPTSVTLWSIIISFTVAAATGLIFGIYPPARPPARTPSSPCATTDGSPMPSSS